MIAKLVAFGEDRDAALSRLRAALDECEIVGVETNLRLLKAILRSDDFAAARIDTQFLPRHPELARGAASPLGADVERIVLAAGAAFWLARAQAAAGETPFGVADGWRLNGEARQKLVVSLEGVARELVVAPLGDGRLRLDAVGAFVLVEATLRDARMSLRLDGVKRELSVVARGKKGCVVIVDGCDHVLEFIDPLAPPRAETVEGAAMTAPLPARVTRLFAAAGDEVRKGAPLVTLEAMKMEIALAAPRDGRIRKIACGVGDMVEQGEELVLFAEGDAA
jgi:3-methylcrotonyl-CoA carboxylase alpha subunit